jgi:rSAM/selenodomain-associated transferase 2
VRLATTAEPSAYPALCPTPTMVEQPSGDLGARMARLLADGLSDRLTEIPPSHTDTHDHAAKHGGTHDGTHDGKHDQGGTHDGIAAVLLLGTDSPALPSSSLSAALKALSTADIVLGPCENGGFWCLGVNARASQRCAEVALATWLDDLDWSQQDTRPAVESRANAWGLTVAHAPSWFDVDYGTDLPRLDRALRDAPLRAPRTRAALKAFFAAASTSAEGPHPASQQANNHGRRLADHNEQAPQDSAGDAVPLVSLIVSTLNEGLRLDKCCAALADLPGPVEIIVADGGSSDGSNERVADRADVTVVRCSPGRGRQLAAGAALATGDIFAFVHADAVLPKDATTHMRQALAASDAQPPTEAGAFVTRTVADPEFPDRAGVLLRFADFRSRFTKYPYGDQVLFMTAKAYRETGGFRPLPIMEDYDLSVRLARRAPIARIPVPIVVSGRRMQQHPFRVAWMMRVIPPLYRLGVPPERLAKWYRGG